MSDSQAFFQEIVHTNRRRLAGIARSYAAAADRDDLLQEILLQLWRSLPRFERRSSPDTWLYRVALNTALTWKRRQQRRPLADQPLDEEAAPPAVLVSNGEGPRRQVEVLDEFIASLGDVDRAVFLLYLDDQSYRGISEITGLSEGAVGVRLHRLKKLFTSRYIEA